MSRSTHRPFSFSPSEASSQKANIPGLLQKRWFYHLLFWLAYYAFAASISLSIHQIHDWHFYLTLLLAVPPDMLLVYLNIGLLIPALLFRRRFTGYFLSLTITLIGYGILTTLMHRLFAMAGVQTYASVTELNLRNISTQLLNGFYLLGLTTGIKLVKDWMQQQQRWQEKEQQHVATELDFLKSQINPHFFFNTLNNLYSLTVKKSDLAPEVVLKLSDLMSYILYESSAARIPLDKELSAIDNYMAIERLRFGKRLDLHFDQDGPTSPISIPPLILLAFVENSFKHGLKNQLGTVSIHIRLSVRPDALHFCISNPEDEATTSTSVPASTTLAHAHQAPITRHANEAAVPKQDHPDTLPRNGIGLRNITRRLDLLYNSAYTLEKVRQDGQFIIHLMIPL